MNSIYRNKKDRLSDNNEIEITLTDNEASTYAAVCTDCGIPFCHGVGCSLFNIIPDINEAVKQKHWKMAWDILSSTSSMPEIISRICPALCEYACTKSINFEPVMIRQIEKFIADKAFEMQLIENYKQNAKTGKRIAIVGAGPAGLTAAIDLFQMGHDVIIFEKQKQGGGLLRYGIPNFKLDKNIIDRRIDLMQKSGIQFIFNTEVGIDISINYLQKNFDAVLFAIGAYNAKDLLITGRELKNIYFALDLLSDQNMVISGEKNSNSINVRDKKVIIIGAGDTGNDCLGTILRQGAQSVTQIDIMPEPPINRAEFTPWPNKPYQLLPSSSNQEGGNILWSKMVKGFQGINGILSGITIANVQWDFDKQGKPISFKETANSDTLIDADYAFIAIGYAGVEKSDVIQACGLKVNKQGTVFSAEKRGLFTCGDMQIGSSLVIKAMANAKETAVSIDKYLRG